MGKSQSQSSERAVFEFFQVFFIIIFSRIIYGISSYTISSLSGQVTCNK
jgi:hypothetical protein